MHDITHVKEAKTIDLNTTENGKRPLSFRKKRAWYTGTLTTTTSQHRTICGIKPRTRLNFTIPPTKLKRLSTAKVAMMSNMTEELPNSSISCSYLFDKSSSTTLVVMANAVCDNPSWRVMVSMKAKVYEAVLRISHIRCELHHALSVSPQVKDSAMLQAFLARYTYANGRNHRLDT
ncbi:unnamed protein product [Camellia sinensis]